MINLSLKTVLESSPFSSYFSSSGNHGYYFMRIKSIKGFDNYSVSDCGKVFKNGKQIAGVLSSSGKYRKVCLSKNGSKHYFDIHRLVAQAFIGDINGKVINHIDFNGHNNNYTNLEIVTQKQNIKHTINNNRHCYGKRHFRYRITDKDLFLAHYLKNFGFKIKEIEISLNLTKNTICTALRDRVYNYKNG